MNYINQRKANQPRSSNLKQITIIPPKSTHFLISVTNLDRNFVAKRDRNFTFLLHIIYNKRKLIIIILHTLTQITL